MMCTVCEAIKRRLISPVTKMPIGFTRRSKRRFTTEDERDPRVVAHAAMMLRDEMDAQRGGLTS